MEEDRSYCYNPSQEIVVTSDNDPVLTDKVVIQEEIQEVQDQGSSAPLFNSDEFVDLYSKCINQ